MKCDEVRETMPDVAAGLIKPSGEVQQHLQACAPCAAQLQEFQKTMAMLDEWEAPEPSAYFDTRLAARLRAEKIAQNARGTGWFGYFRGPALAALTALMIMAGIGVYSIHQFAPKEGGVVNISVPSLSADTATPQRGTAVSDLQTLDSDNDLYADFDVLDDIDSHQNQAAATN